ncbi:MAG TPA: S9 family peptidase [Gammaproteobacteria bacterium]
MKRAAACGSWPSPLSVEMAAGAQRRLMQPRAAADGTYWLEGRPEEGGRVVLVHHAGGANHDLTPRPFSVRSRAHEYGGGAYSVTAGGVFFCNDADQCIYKLEDAAPRRITEPGPRRYADLSWDAPRGRLLCVCEDTDGARPEDALVAVSLEDGALTPLAQGRDFFSSPALSPDGGQLAWLAWDDPQMPWDGCELWLARIAADGSLRDARRIAGGPEESIFQPRWSPEGLLHFVSDRTGWWNLYRYAGGKAEALCPDAADYGYAQWNFGMSSYGFLAGGGVAAVRVERGASSLVRIGAGGKRQPLEARYTHIEHLDAAEGRIALVGGAWDAAPAVVAGEPGALAKVSGPGFALQDGYISRAEAVSFPTSGGETAHGWYYPPAHGSCAVPEGERPPLILRCHGGPTSMNGAALEPRVQFWTSRGFALFDLNYRGSTGYGRAYRRSLAGEWGVKDIEDCVRALAYLAGKGLADPCRAAVSGSSAGGFTALAAVAFRDAFRAASIQYGISELETAMTDTHKFEARYGDMLLGPWPAAREVYRERSPLHAAARIRVPVLFFQGLKDTVVPPDQTARMVLALKGNGVPTACLTFPEEGHGFRRADTLRRVLEAELAFYAQVFGLTPADALAPLELAG